MQTDKREQTREESKDIVVLDAGIKHGDDPDWACCFANLIPLRW